MARLWECWTSSSQLALLADCSARTLCEFTARLCDLPWTPREVAQTGR